jgi:hypothetical protein
MQSRQLVLALAFGLGMFAMMCGPLLGLTLGLSAVLRNDGGAGNRLAASALALTAAILGIGAGAALVWAAQRAWRGAASRPLALPGLGWWLPIFA